ncbi:Hint domain-containing protein [Oceaniglobus trochenteri]|uniref:Hint domain-containing protein n=1 Tax=Oceaniglobus trochenteri TaxID=2763260 RepID=UPI001CFFD150|nr:Hint domain-containing protein [Oceaniglobus trochenteri]
MTYSRQALSGAANGTTSTQWTVRRRTVPRVEDRPTRRFSVQWIDRLGNFDELARVAPAIPLFEDAFSAFGRGTLIPTINGPVAIEDLVPGTPVETTTGLAPLMWTGAMTVVPGSAAQEVAPLRMYRIAADAFGLGRPMPDLLLGQGARLLNRGAAVRAAHGTEAVLEPVGPMADGVSVIEIHPVSTIQTYHLGFMSHRTVLANGVEVESMHPGTLNPNRIEPSLLSLYLSMFPHVRQIADFGRLSFPRVGSDARAGMFAA